MLCVMDTTSGLQADARGFTVGELSSNAYDKVLSAGLLGWCFVVLRPFQGGSYRVILSWSSLYSEFRLPAGQNTAGDLGLFTGILVVLGDFGGSCFSLLCLGLPREINHLLLSLSALMVPVQGGDGRCCDRS